MRKDGLIRIDNLFYRVDNSLIGQEVEIQHDETSITVLKGNKTVARPKTYLTQLCKERQLKSRRKVHLKSKQRLQRTTFYGRKQNSDKSSAGFGGNDYKSCYQRNKSGGTYRLFLSNFR